MWRVGKKTSHGENDNIYLRPDETIIVISGLIKLRDHAGSVANPNLCWLMYPGDYINSEVHHEIFKNPEIWIKAEKTAETLTVDNATFQQLI